jgi:hypothetical protein
MVTDSTSAGSLEIRIAGVRRHDTAASRACWAAVVTCSPIAGAVIQRRYPGVIGQTPSFCVIPAA